MRPQQIDLGVLGTTRVALARAAHEQLIEVSARPRIEVPARLLIAIADFELIESHVGFERILDHHRACFHAAEIGKRRCALCSARHRLRQRRIETEQQHGNAE